MTVRAPKIDIATGDYSITNGSLTEDITAASEVVLALRSKRGSSAIAPWYGSRLHTITKLLPVAPRLAEAYAREALQFLVDRGALRDLKVSASIAGRSLKILVSYRDRSGQRRAVTYQHRVLG